MFKTESQNNTLIKSVLKTDIFVTFVYYCKKKFLKEKIQISGFTDEELLKKYKETSDSEYFGSLYNRYIPLIYGLCLKYLKDQDKAQDAVMQIFENVVSKILNYPVLNFKTWIYSVAKNHCLQEIRSSKKEIVVDFNSEIMESEDIVHLLEEKDEQEDRFKILEKCMELLPPPQRVAVNLFFFKEKSYIEIADITNNQLKSVKSFIQNGKRNLKICIEKNLK